MNQRDIDRIIVHDARGMPIKRKEGAIYKDNTADPTVNNTVDPTLNTGYNTNLNTGVYNTNPVLVNTNPVLVNTNPNLVNTGYNPALNTGLGTTMAAGTTGVGNNTVANDYVDPNHHMSFKEKLTHKYADWKERRRQKKLAKNGQVGTGADLTSSSDEDAPSKAHKRSTTDDKALSYDRTSTLIPGLQAPVDTTLGVPTGVNTGLNTGLGAGSLNNSLSNNSFNNSLNAGYNNVGLATGLNPIDNSGNLGIVTDNLQPNVAPTGYVGTTLAGAQGLNTSLPGYNTSGGILQGNIPSETKRDRAKTGTWEFPDQRMSQVSQTVGENVQPVVQQQPVVVNNYIPVPVETITTQVPVTTEVTEVTTTQWNSNLPVTEEFTTSQYTSNIPTNFVVQQQTFDTPVYYNQGLLTAQNLAGSLSQNVWSPPQNQQFISQQPGLLNQGLSTGVINQNIPMSSVNTGLLQQNFQQQNLIGGLGTDVTTGMTSFGKGVSADVLQPGMVGDLGTGLTNFGSSGTTLNQPSLLQGGRQAVNSNIPDIHTNLPTGSMH